MNSKRDLTFDGPNRELAGKAKAIDACRRVALDMDSTEIPVYGEQERSAYNGHFESTCFHPLLLFDRAGDCLAAKLRPGNLHSAEGSEELLLAEGHATRRLFAGMLRKITALALPAG